MSAPAAPAAARAGATAARRASLRVRAAAAAAALLALVIGLTVAFGGSQRARPAAGRATPSAPPPLIQGVTLQRARCAEWLAATPKERALAVSALATTAGAPTEYRGLRGSTLTREETYALLDNACSRPVARGFLLYVLYVRAAGFSSTLRNSDVTSSPEV